MTYYISRSFPLKQKTCLHVFMSKKHVFQSECRLYLGHRLGSTHYWQWNSQEQTFMHTRDWPPSSIRESEVTERYGDCKWKIEQ